MQNNKEKKNVFEIENLSFAYDKHEVLNNLNLSFHEGIVTTMIGPNGCGKSTLLQLMTKNLKPAGGKILLQGEDIAQIRQKQFAQSVAVVHQYNTAPPDLTVEKLVSYGRIPYHKMGVPFDKAKDMERIEWALENYQYHKSTRIRRSASFPADRNSVCGLQWHWRRMQRFCCWTSRQRIWISAISFRFCG